MLYIRRVSGNSMSPYIKNGQLVIFVKKNIDVGDVVLAVQQNIEVVKRVAKIDGQKIWLQGDNSLESTDSRELGPVLRTQIKSKLVWPK